MQTTGPGLYPRRRANGDRLRAAGVATKPSSATRPLLTWMAAAAAAPLAFVVALWLTNPKPLMPGVEALAGATVSDSPSLMAAVQTAGLHGSNDIKGAIEEISRIDAERVKIRGWATDATSGSPLAIVVFAGRAHLLAAVSDSDNSVARLAGATTNTSFSSTFSCTRGEKIHIVAVADGRRYSQFRSLVCP
jgi:hypothetical protein